MESSPSTFNILTAPFAYNSTSWFPPNSVLPDPWTPDEVVPATNGSIRGTSLAFNNLTSPPASFIPKFKSEPNWKASAPPNVRGLFPIKWDIEAVVADKRVKEPVVPNTLPLALIFPVALMFPEDVILLNVFIFKLLKEPVNAVIVPLELKFPLEVILPVIKCLSVDPFPKVTPSVVIIVLELIPTEAVIPPNIVKDPVILEFPFLEPSHSAVTPVNPEPSPDIDIADIVPLELTFPVMLIFAKELVLAIVKLFAIISPLELIVALAVICVTAIFGLLDNPEAFPDKEPVSWDAIIVLPLIILPVMAPLDIVSPEFPSTTKLLNEPVPATLKLPLADMFVEVMLPLALMLFEDVMFPNITLLPVTAKLVKFWSPVFVPEVVPLKLLAIIVPLALILPEDVMSPLIVVVKALIVTEPESTADPPAILPKVLIVILPPVPAPDPFPAFNIKSPPSKAGPNALPASKVKFDPAVLLFSSGASIFIEVEPLVNTILLEIKVFAIIFPLALILPEDVISPKALTLKLPNEADVASINPLALIFPFILKKPSM